MSTTTTAEEPSPFTDAPAPWNCKGELFWLNGYISPSNGQYASAANFGVNEENSTYSDASVTGEYKGGLTACMIIRYSESPVGPYDEIIWSPGKFKVPVNGKDVWRITRIYVSSKESAYNGRKNWNIPKALAHFAFTPNPKAGPKDLPYTKISIAPPEDPENPFFVLDLTPTWLFSSASIPFSTTLVPISFAIINPPLPQSPNWRENGLVGTDHWWGLTPLIKGNAGLFWPKGGLDGGKYGDDVGFPEISPFGVGLWLKDFTLQFPVGEDPAKDKSA